MRNVLLAITLFASACAARPSRPTLSPAARAAVLAHYIHGESLEAIAIEFHLDGRADARAVVHDGLLSLNKRYYRDR